MNLKKLKVPKRMRITSIGASKFSKFKGTKMARSFKRIKKINVSKKLRSFKKRTVGSSSVANVTAASGGGSRMGIRRNSTKFIAMVKKNIMRPKFPRHKGGSKGNSKNIIIIHNNTSITSNEEDNRSSCVEIKEMASLKEEDVTSIDSAAPPANDQASKEEETTEEEKDEEEDIQEDFMILRLREEKAAIHVQSVFRGHLARRAFRALKSLVKLQAVVRGVCVRRQARIALHCMNTLVRLQVKVRARQLFGRPSNAIINS